MKYKFKRKNRIITEEGYFITEDDHKMFPEDVKKKLNRVDYLEVQNKKMMTLLEELYSMSNFQEFSENAQDSIVLFLKENDMKIERNVNLDNIKFLKIV